MTRPGRSTAQLQCSDASLRASQIVTAVPEVRQLALQSGDEFLLLACDGIWDVLTNQEVWRLSLFPQMTALLVCSGAEPSPFFTSKF